MSETEHSYTIVVGTDFSETSNLAMDAAFEFASQKENADVHVVFVEDELTTPRTLAAGSGEESELDEVMRRVQKRATERLTGLSKRMTLKIRHVVAHIRRGSPAEHIVQLAAHLDADLIVVGTHGRRGIERVLLGSVAERVSRIARCPVFVMRPKDHEGVGKVPEIEPPCPKCVQMRQESGGQKLWCERHSEHHIRPHTYHYGSGGMYSSDRAASGSGEATPGSSG